MHIHSGTGIRDENKCLAACLSMWGCFYTQSPLLATPLYMWKKRYKLENIQSGLVIWFWWTFFFITRLSSRIKHFQILYTTTITNCHDFILWIRPTVENLFILNINRKIKYCVHTSVVFIIFSVLHKNPFN